MECDYNIDQGEFKGYSPSPTQFLPLLSKVEPICSVIIFPLTTCFLTAQPVTDCQTTSIAMNVFCILSMACASFLFLRRLHAVYSDNRIIRGIFTLLWIGMSTCGIPVFIGVHVGYIPGTNYCISYKIEEYVSVIDFFPAAFDTLVFFAISYKVLAVHGVAEEGRSWKDIVTGKALPQLSRALLQGGQQYYLSVSGLIMLSKSESVLTYLILIIQNCFWNCSCIRRDTLCSRLRLNNLRLHNDTCINIIDCIHGVSCFP